MIVGCQSCVVNNCFKGHLNPVCCIFRSHALKIDFWDEHFKNLLVWNHKACDLDIWYVASPNGPLPSLYKLCPLGQKRPRPVGHMFYIGVRGVIKKFSAWYASAGWPLILEIRENGNKKFPAGKIHVIWKIENQGENQGIWKINDIVEYYQNILKT